MQIGVHFTNQTSCSENLCDFFMECLHQYTLIFIFIIIKQIIAILRLSHLVCKSESLTFASFIRLV